PQAVMCQLDARQRAMCMYGVAHQRQRGNVIIVPKPRFHVRRDVAAEVHFADLGEYDAPSSLGLDGAHRRHPGWVSMSHPVAMRDLIEAVSRGDRADADRLEEDVVTGRSAHLWSTSSRSEKRGVGIGCSWPLFFAAMPALEVSRRAGSPQQCCLN